VPARRALITGIGGQDGSYLAELLVEKGYEVVGMVRQPLAALGLVGVMRERFGVYASCGILYNHESPRRPLDFVTRKVSHAAAAISLGLKSEVLLGNLDARRDWGYAGDYVRAMWLVLQEDEADDFVIASGETHSVRELAAAAFAHVGLDWEDHVRVDDTLIRGKAELHDIVGDASKARAKLGWSPRIDFDGLVQLLVDADVERLRARLEPVETLADI